MYRRTALLLILLILFLKLANTQPHTNYIKDFQRAERLYALENPTEKTDSLALELYQRAATNLAGNPLHNSVVFDCYLKSGILQQTASNHQQSISSFFLANKIQQQTGMSDSLRFKPYLFIGTAYYALNNFDSASYFFQQAENIANRYPHLSELERLYNKKGTMFYETGNYIQSKVYFEKALSMLDTSEQGNRYLYVNYKNNIASALRKLQEYPEALAVYQSLLPFGIERNGLLHNIGDTYLGMGKYDEAINYLHFTTYSTDKKFNDIGFAFLRLKKFDSAFVYLKKALGLVVKNRKSISAGVTYTYLGELYTGQSRYNEALDAYQQAIIQLDPNFDDLHITENPKEFEGIHSYSKLFDALAGKANAFYLQSKATDYRQRLIVALNTLSASFDLATRTEETYESDEARLFLNQEVQPAYQSFVDWALEAYELTGDKSWLIQSIVKAESSKAAVLQASLLQLPLYDIKGIPQELLRKERNLKSLITRYNLLSNSGEDSVQVKHLQQGMMDAQIDLSKIHKQLLDQPAYSALWNKPMLDVKSIQNDLSKDEAILSFYITSSTVTTYVITKDSILFRKLDSSAALLNEVLLLSEANNASVDNRELVTKISRTLYDKLIGSFWATVEHISKLVISPHNELAYLPFEILLDSTGGPLLNRFSIRYAYSLSLMHVQEQHDKNLRLTAFAPFTSKGFPQTGLVSIPASLDEVSYLKGQVLIDSSATKKQFIQLSQQMGIVHLATHAATNDSLPLESFIAFYPVHQTDTSYKLYEPEIYNLDLRKSRLVILSACETGKGKLVHGEGILSLSRAFSYAGCPSIITSLWKADDQATAYICKRLHHYLSNGSTKDVALQKAKLDYLEDKAVPNQFKLPHYWAHLILVGDPSPVYSSSGVLFWWILPIVAFLLAAIFVLSRFKKRHSSHP